MNGQGVVTFDVDRHAIFSGCFSPDSRFILSGDDDGTVRVWDVLSGQMLRGRSENRICGIMMATMPF